MTNAALDQALEDIYASLKNDNEELDAHILALKIILHTRKEKSVEIDPTRLAQPNRQGRKMMQSYFKKRGVTVTFKDVATPDSSQ